MAIPSAHFTFNNHPQNVVFIVIKTKSNYYSIVKYNTTEAIIGLAISSLLNVLQLKYQVSAVSPFKTHPILMAIAIGSLLVYCFGCDLEHHSNSIHCSSKQTTLVQNALRFFAFISVASFLTIILSACSSSSTQPVSVYLVFGLFYSARLIIQCIQKRSSVQDSEGYNYYNSSQRRVNSPFHNAFTNQMDTLPVYFRPSTMALID